MMKLDEVNLHPSVGLVSIPVGIQLVLIQVSMFDFSIGESKFCHDGKSVLVRSN